MKLPLIQKRVSSALVVNIHASRNISLNKNEKEIASLIHSIAAPKYLSRHGHFLGARDGRIFGWLVQARHASSHDSAVVTDSLERYQSSFAADNVYGNINLTKSDFKYKTQTDDWPAIRSLPSHANSHVLDELNKISFICLLACTSLFTILH